MCTNYRPTARDLVQEQLGLLPPTFSYAEEVWPQMLAPMLIASADRGAIEWRESMFGLVPFWADGIRIARQTYNARSETAATKPSFRGPWRQRRFCLLPMQAFYEPSYETGKAVRWRIERRDRRAFTVAGLWDTWVDRDRAPEHRLHSFSMLTINSGTHPLMARFHKPGDEKRSLAVIAPPRREAWLHADAEGAAAMLVDLPADEFQAMPDPLLRRPG